MSQNSTNRCEGCGDAWPPSDCTPLRPGPLPRYQLILQAGAAMDMMFVVRTIMELTRLCRAEATHKMWQAHLWGQSRILVTFKERAELYVEQFADRGLCLSMEPAGGSVG
jgi:ATP-dependent Clp protease adapter protein ClpS